MTWQIFHLEGLISIPIMSFTASVGGEPVERFDRPMPVSFDVSGIDPKAYSTEELEQQLMLHVRNEETEVWENAGGVYDPVTRTLTTLRGHFSIYRVWMDSIPFMDMRTDHWAYAAATMLRSKGVLEAEQSFEPSAQVTRGEFAAWIVRALGLQVLQPRRWRSPISATASMRRRSRPPRSMGS
ncbi:S-layer homology domain-containing protein [Paenibacillus sp. IB182496]|uniref:S-layer homology domain-containing protein n=1 Tax=Paenibacillus sabuli TaxID=2772509 RepID=A0A927BNQ9_9BACL|nr:S-layer homology domain-containing protein [Paenibacillus sabuli]MBD2843911.1 S-layer homology domain-containing protein [Paenibacillus sabuli]